MGNSIEFRESPREQTTKAAKLPIRRPLASANRQLVAQSYAEAGRQLLVDHHFEEAVPYLLAARQSGQDSPPLRTLFREAKQHLPVIPPLEHQGTVLRAAFSPDGTRVVTASGDKTARVWDAATGKPLTGALAHQGPVVSAAFSPDGTRVVTASEDKTARMWDAATGKPLTGALKHQGEVVSATFSPDGTRIVTARLDNTARVWDVSPDTGTLDQWSAVAERSAFVLSEQRVLVRRSPPERAQTPSY